MTDLSKVVWDQLTNGAMLPQKPTDVAERVEQARIDHAEEARAVLAEVVSGEGNIPVDWAGISDNEQWMISASYAEAQVHATLAVHEQLKRIADALEARS